MCLGEHDVINLMPSDARALPINQRGKNEVDGVNDLCGRLGSNPDTPPPQAGKQPKWRPENFADGKGGEVRSIVPPERLGF
jgi:hypothetical protein